MTETLQFSSSAIEQVEKDYSKLELTAHSKEIINNFAKVYTRFLPISELAIKGFISFAMRDFQVQTRVEVTEVLHLPPAEKQKNIGILMTLFVDRMGKALLKQEQKAKLAVAIQEANKVLARL